MNSVEALYPLSPMQQGMLFHSLHSPDAGEYFRQLSLSLTGELDAAAFQSAWRAALQRHSVLRSAFVWEGVREPVQAVLREMELPWEEYHWERLPAGRQSKLLADLLEQDELRGFPVGAPPLIRFSLVYLGNSRHEFVFSFHHAILDGWSIPLLLAEVFENHAAGLAGRAFQAKDPVPYRDYVVWLKKQDLAAAERFWRGYLTGFATATDIRLGSASVSRDGSHSYGELAYPVSGELYARLKIFARMRRLTLNTILKGVWSLLLSRYGGSGDVVFGSVVSGRSAPIARVEEMIGLLLNVLPVRATVDGRAIAAEWLQALQANHAAVLEWEWTPLNRIRDWAETSAGEPLFESLFAFENYPAPTDLLPASGQLRAVARSASERTSFPLTLTVTAGQDLAVLFTYDLSRFRPEAIARMAAHFGAA
ncbi:MAG: condensation domain-containing protein, partial [Acidobacteriota bacterium]|nr:condensation domain-containing protein [Acidobacteriota bacterium]